ncbi:hypothetical protein HDU83_002110 [Entophlyctis luteolus]|nr:hypothetical protein HDU83_002110 [Entophlyctis luteolus]
MVSIAFLPNAIVSSADLDGDIVTAADGSRPRKSRGRAVGSEPVDQRILSGHLGVTPAFVQGYVRVIVDPDFSAAHPHLVTRPTLSIKFRGFVRAAKGSASIILRKTPLRSLQWTDNIIIDRMSSIDDAFDLGIREDSDLCLLLPGTYDVPFCFDLPNTLPPTLSGYDGKVWYYLSVTMKFKEDHNGGYAFFDKSFSQPVVIRYPSIIIGLFIVLRENRRYNSEHIINQQETAELHPSSAVSPFFDLSDLDNNQSTTSRRKSINSDCSPQQRPMTHDFNPASMSPPIRSLHANNSGISDFRSSGDSSPLSLRRTTTGEFSLRSDNFAEPATYSNLNSEDPIRYHIVVPNRSFGPDDPIVVNLHISKLPEVRIVRVASLKFIKGFEIHHVDLIVRASITRESSKGPITTSQMLMRYRDIPESSGTFWNRKINISAVKLFKSPRKSPSLHHFDTSETSSSFENITQQSVEAGEITNQSITGEVNEQPPPFEQVVPDLNVPRFYGLSRRTALLQTLAEQSRSSARSESPLNGSHDAGISAGNSAVFQPWTFPDSAGRFSISTGGVDLARSLSSRFLRNMGRQTPAQSIRSGSIRPNSDRSNDEEESNEGDEGTQISNGNSDEGVDETQTNASESFLGSSWNLGSTRAFTESVQSARHNSQVAPRPSLSIDTLSRSLSVPIVNINSGSNAYPVQTVTPSPSSVPPLPHPILHSRQPQAPLDYEQENTSFQDQPHALPQQKTPVQRIFDISQRIFGLKPKKNPEDGPLSTFTTPYVSVKHTLRIEIVCHKPLLLGVGSQPIFLGQSTNVANSASGTRVASDSNSNDINNPSGERPPQSSGGGFLRKVVPLGFRYTTAIEIPVVVHSASVRDKQFLQSYLYGPPTASGGTEDRDAGVNLTTGAAVVNYVGEVAPAYER